MSLTHVPEEEIEDSSIDSGGTKKTWIYSPRFEELLEMMVDKLTKIEYHLSLATDVNLENTKIGD